jgi:hypothetical protein
MKKFLYIAAALVIALVSCNKNNVEDKTIAGNSSVPAWVSDESLPVPVLFSQGDMVQTKSGLIEAADFEDAAFYYGITAYDAAYPEVRLFQTSDNHVKAKNVSDETYLETSTSGKYHAQIVDDNNDPITYYYPLQSKNNFTFFGYRTNEDDDFALTWTNDQAYINGIEIGHQDVLWAKGEAAGGLTDASSQNIYGYNAKYIRAAWKQENNDAALFYANWAPKLHFNHILSAFQFVIKTDPGRKYDPNDASTEQYKDDAAKKFVTADIYVTELTVTGLHTTANLLVTAYGMDLDNNFKIDPDDIADLLSTSGSTAPITVQNVVNPTLPWAPAAPVASGDYYFPQYNDGNGADYGEPLLVLPTAVEDAANNTEDLVATIKFHVPNQDTTEDIDLTLTKPANGFEAGKRYVFTILVHSPEEIEVVTSLEPWETDNTYDGGIEIE